jgi:hypothetical protein
VSEDDVRWYRSFLEAAGNRIGPALADLSAEEAARLWRTHLYVYLRDNRAALAPAQVSLLEECLGAMSPELFASDESTRQQWAKDIEAKAEALFPPDQARWILTMRR